LFLGIIPKRMFYGDNIMHTSKEKEL